MEPIFITRKNGSIYQLNTAGRIVESAKQVRHFMEDDYVDIVVLSTSSIAFAFGDMISVYGRKYWLNKLPEVDKQGSRNLKYTVRFEGAQYTMARVAFLLNVTTTTNQLQDVQGNSFIGDVESFIDVVVANMNRVYPGKWASGSIVSGTDADTLITFDEGENCLSVLQTICDTFDQEFDITESSGVFYINIRNHSTTFPYPFKYGDHQGLYSLTRSNSGSENIINKLWVYGGTNNLTLNYQSDRLLLANKTRSTSFIKDDTQIALNGMFEGVKTFDDIYPTREGSVTAVSSDVKKFVDTTMFDLNDKWANTQADYQWYLELKGLQDTTGNQTNYQSHVVNTTKYLIAGTAATLHFNSGKLAGYDFEITSYDHSTHTFTLKQSQDERGNNFPSDTDSAFQIAISDKYTLTNIMLPKSYITAAQSRLMSAAQSYLNKMCTPLVKYDLKVDEKYIKWKCPNDMVAIDCGDYVNLTDSDFVGETTRIRVSSVERSIIDKYNYELELEDVNLYRERRRVVVGDSIAESNSERYQLTSAQSSGTNGVTFTPAVSSDGVISWTNDGGLSNPTPRSIRGPKGESATLVHSVEEVKTAEHSLSLDNTREYIRMECYNDAIIYVDAQVDNEKYLLLHNTTESEIDIIVNGSNEEEMIGDTDFTIDPGRYTEISIIYDDPNYIVTSKNL